MVGKTQPKTKEKTAESTKAKKCSNVSTSYVIQNVGELQHVPSVETRSWGASYFYINYVLLPLAIRKNVCNLHPAYHNVWSHHQVAEQSFSFSFSVS